MWDLQHLKGLSNAPAPGFQTCIFFIIKDLFYYRFVKGYYMKTNFFLLTFTILFTGIC